MPIWYTDISSHTCRPQRGEQAYLFHPGYYGSWCMDGYLWRKLLSAYKEKNVHRREPLRWKRHVSVNTHAAIKCAGQIGFWRTFPFKIWYYGAVCVSALHGMPPQRMEYAAYGHGKCAHQWTGIFFSECLGILGGRPGAVIPQKVYLDPVLF